MKTIKIRLLTLGRKQVELLDEIRKRGYPGLATTQLYTYINHPGEAPQCVAVLKIVEDVLTEWEKTSA